MRDIHSFAQHIGELFAKEMPEDNSLFSVAVEPTEEGFNAKCSYAVRSRQAMGVIVFSMLQECHKITLSAADAGMAEKIGSLLQHVQEVELIEGWRRQRRGQIGDAAVNLVV